MGNWIGKRKTKVEKKKVDRVSKPWVDGDWLYHVVYDYRFDFFAVVIMIAFTMYYVEVLLRPGQIVFSDIDFPFNSATYLDEVFGIWNTKWNTTSMLNIPRLIVLLPTFLISKMANDNGDLFLKSFVVQNLIVSGNTFYLFCKRLVSVYIGRDFNMSRIFVIIFGSLYYALNPWVIFRIQHIYLLVGYSFFPLIILLFFKIFDHKFQEAAIEGYNPFEKKLYPSNIRDIILLAFVITLASAAIHYFFYTVFILAPLLGLLIFKYMVKYRKKEISLKKAMWIGFLKKIILLGTLMVGFSFYWLFIYIGSILFDVQASQNNINVIDTYVAFSRNSSLKEVLYFISYWWPMIDLRQLPLSFYIGGGIILIISLIGLIFHITKHHIVLFMGLLSVVLLIFATGVHYPFLAKGFIMVTELPVIGSIFRDPNKLVALLALFLAVFFVFGLELLIRQGDKLSAYRYIYIYTVIGIAAISVFTYLMPMKDLYVDHFYAPIEEPKSYKELKAYYGEDKEHYGIYLPLADEMIQPYSLVSTPYWNVNEESTQTVTKATGDLQVYNSPIPTLFQFEGNDPVIPYYYNYIQYLLDQGRTDRISTSVKAYGGDQLIYHDEYNQQYYRQDFNLQVLHLDENLEVLFENDIFTVFEMVRGLEKRNNNYSLLNEMIQTPYGFERTAVYEKMDLYDPLKTPIIYLNQNGSQAEGIEEISFETRDISTMVEVKNEEDILFSKLPESYYLYPFNWTNQGNVFLGWSKTFLSSVDWSWYLESQDMKDRSFEFDRGQGVAVTFASNRLAIEPYLRDKVKGKLVMDFDTMLRTENLFVPDNPDLFEINSNPYSEVKEFQTLHGQLIKGDPKNIWQVAKSGILDANGATPYYFELLISGRDVDKIHLKVRFYNDDNEEIGVSYIVSSSEESYFDTIKFIGEVITPSQTSHMRLDLLTFQNPEFKSYWWIHDINIYDLSQYVEENRIGGEYEALTSDEYDVYIRSFNSDKGGNLELQVGTKVFELNTFDEKKNTLEWQHLGTTELSQGIHTVDLIGKDGFNAVNAIVIIPHSVYRSAKDQVKKELEDVGIIMTFEPSIDLEYEGNIQSERLYPTLSLGKGIALEEGYVEGKFDILQPGEYTFYPNVQYIEEIKGSGSLSIYDKEEIIETWELTRRSPVSDREKMVEYTTNSDTYPYSFIDLLTPYTFEDTLGYSVYLEPGEYRFRVELISETENKTHINQILPFDPSIIEFPTEDTQTSEVGSCERITPDMMHEEVDGNNLLITLDPTCSTDWYSYGTNKIKVSINEEYLIRFDARSKLLTNRHGKVLFLDEDNKFVDVVYINEVEEQYKEEWNHYEQLVKVPKGASRMIIQFLGRGDREAYSTLEISDFEVFNYNEFILLDHLYVENEAANAIRLSDMAIKDVKTVRQLTQFGLTYSFSETGVKPIILNTFLSPNKNWRLDGAGSDYLLNGITQGYRVSAKNDLEFKLLLMPGYLFGLGLHVMTLLLSIIWLFKNGLGRRE